MKLLGQFYREKVLSQKKLMTVELPTKKDEINIEEDLFSWKLIVGRKVIGCRSKEEAEYLKIFVQIGLQEIKVPKDMNYLKEILPELMDLKTKTDAIIDMHLRRIMSRRLRREIRAEVWIDIMK